MAVMSESRKLPAAEALRLLGEVRFGRVVYTSKAMPAIRLVPHVVADGQIVIAAGPEVAGNPLSISITETILAYEADQFDTDGGSGWTVVVVGHARALSGPERAEAAARMPRLPAASEPLIGISPEVITGYRLASGRGDPLAAG